MAKGKPLQSKKAMSASPTKSKAKSPVAAASKAKAAAKPNGEKSAGPIPDEAMAPAFSGITIGHAAGKIWGLLSTDGAQTIAAIKKGVDAPPEVVVAGLGWLAREDKLVFDGNGTAVKISLK